MSILSLLNYPGDVSSEPPSRIDNMPHTAPSRWRQTGDLASPRSLSFPRGSDTAIRLPIRSTRSTPPTQRPRSSRAPRSHSRRCTATHCPWSVNLSPTRKSIHCRLDQPRWWDAAGFVQHHLSLLAASSYADPEMYRSFDITASPISNLPKAIIAKAIPGATVEKVTAIPPARLQRLFEITLGDSRTMLLSMSPPELLRLLRSEQSLVRSEGVTVRWLKDLVSPNERSDHDRMQASGAEATQGFTGGSGVTEQGEHGKLPELGVTLPAVEEGAVLDDGSLHDLLPTLVAQSAAPAAGTPYEIPFALYDMQPGVPLVSLDQALTQRQQNTLDFQAGKLACRLSEITPESGRFGPAVHVLSPTPRSPVIRAFGNFGTPALQTAGTWSLAFHTLFEAVLRDAEDMAVTLGYANIRWHFRRLEAVLDEVTVPRLVVVNLTTRTNLLVSLSDREEAVRPPTVEEAGASMGSEQHARSSQPDIGEVKVEDPRAGNIAAIMGPARTTASEGNIDSTKEKDAKREQEISLTGLRDWSHAVFGDPLFSHAFTDEPSSSFLRGFAGQSVEKALSSTEPFDIKDTYNGHDSHAAIRLLLYQCYHSIVDIVSTFYRPTRTSREQELAARKRLTVVLAKMEEVEIPSSMRRHRRLSGEMSPAKRTKTDDGNDADDDASDAGHGSTRQLSRAVLPRSHTSP